MKIWLVLLTFLSSFGYLSAQTTDSDGDGVPNDKDLCPSTPIGTVINAYGCPTALVNCDYNASSFTLNTLGTAPTDTRYLLVNSATGIIEQITTTPTFSALTGTKTYMVLAYSYSTPPTGLAVGNQLSAVSATCQDFSNALVVKVCVAAVLPTISINDVTVNEDGTTATLTITLSAAQTSGVSVNYATANNTALAGTDYTTTNGTITFAPGETTKTIIIPIIDNTINEPTESVFVNLTTPTGATITDNQGVITILDNDLIDNDIDKDGVPNDKDLCPSTPIGTVVNAYGCPTALVTCDYNASSFTLNTLGTAPTDTRYLLVNSATGIIEQITSTPTFSALTGTKTYMVLAYSYSTPPTGLTVGNQLSAVSATCQDFSNALVVKACVPTALPTISINDVTVNEDGTTATLTITLSAAQTSGVSVNYGTANNTALAGTDYTTTNGTITFAPGETTKTIIIPIIDNTINEPTESVFVNLTTPTGATIVDNQGVITILDNDLIDNDIDKDGVPNDKDLCPSTPIGTVVNAYGCPTALVNCDYNASSFTLNTLGTAPTDTRYLLVNSATGIIEQITTTPTFSALTGTKTYMVLAYSYSTPPTGLAVGNQLSAVSATCQDFSNALVVKVCVSTEGGCDYTTSTITLKTSTPVQTGVTTQYVLVSTSGVILQVVNTPTFTGLSGTNSYNVYAISYSSTINNLSVGNNISTVSGTCFDWSLPLSIKVCICVPNICIPITITKIKQK